jgi:hypothetical protein
MQGRHTRVRTRPALLVSAALAVASLIVPFQGSAAALGDVTCSQETFVFSGTARDLIVPAGGGCDVLGATITRDLIVQSQAGTLAFETTIGRDLIVGPESEAIVVVTEIGRDLTARSAASLFLERATIGHDLLASEPQTVQTGRVDPETPGGPVRVGHDVLIEGSPAGFAFVFDGICELGVGHDFTIARRTVTLGFGIGDNCARNGREANTIGHDLIVTDNTAAVGFFGPSALEVGNNRVGHDLVFARNSAAAGGFLEVSDNVVGHDAICSANSPAASQQPGAGPNLAGHSNSCG